MGNTASSPSAIAAEYPSSGNASSGSASEYYGSPSVLHVGNPRSGSRTSLASHSSQRGFKKGSSKPVHGADQSDSYDLERQLPHPASASGAGSSHHHHYQYQYQQQHYSQNHSNYHLQPSSNPVTSIRNTLSAMYNLGGSKHGSRHGSTGSLHQSKSNLSGADASSDWRSSAVALNAENYPYTNARKSTSAASQSSRSSSVNNVSAFANPNTNTIYNNNINYNSNNNINNMNSSSTASTSATSSNSNVGSSTENVSTPIPHGVAQSPNLNWIYAPSVHNSNSNIHYPSSVHPAQHLHHHPLQPNSYHRQQQQQQQQQQLASMQPSQYHPYAPQQQTYQQQQPPPPIQPQPQHPLQQHYAKNSSAIYPNQHASYGMASEYSRPNSFSDFDFRAQHTAFATENYRAVQHSTDAATAAASYQQNYYPQSQPYQQAQLQQQPPSNQQQYYPNQQQYFHNQNPYSSGHHNQYLLPQRPHSMPPLLTTSNSFSKVPHPYVLAQNQISSLSLGNSDTSISEGQSSRSGSNWALSGNREPQGEIRALERKPLSHISEREGQKVLTASKTTLFVKAAKSQRRASTSAAVSSSYTAIDSSSKSNMPDKNGESKDVKMKTFSSKSSNSKGAQFLEGGANGDNFIDLEANLDSNTNADDDMDQKNDNDDNDDDDDAEVDAEDQESEMVGSQSRNSNGFVGKNILSGGELASLSLSGSLDVPNKDMDRNDFGNKEEEENGDRMEEEYENDDDDITDESDMDLPSSEGMIATFSTPPLGRNSDRSLRSKLKSNKPAPSRPISKNIENGSTPAAVKIQPKNSKTKSNVIAASESNVASQRARPFSGMSKYNSCSTLFIDSTLSKADLDATLRCVSLAIVYMIRKNHEHDNWKSADIITEYLHPLTRHPVSKNPHIPSEDTLFHFLSSLFRAAQLSAECAVITLIYLERMIAFAEITIVASNWKRAVLGALLLASKVWDDQAVWNADFCTILPEVDVRDMNELERWYISAIQFNVSIKSSMYAKYYFELRDLAERTAKNFPLKPLNQEDADRLEARTQFSESAAREVHDAKDDVEHHMRRAKSANNFSPARPIAMVM